VGSNRKSTRLGAWLLKRIEVEARSETDPAALIGRLSQRTDAEWPAELLIDLEEDEPARLHLIEALREALGNTGDHRAGECDASERS
jgi:hypothetical protein